jgi:spermidine synthase
MRDGTRARVMVLWFFFMSGIAGLIYEVVWARLLERVMGATVYSITTVLTVYMAGLALGSYIAGRFIDRSKNPLRIYGLLEGLIGVYCLLIPLIILSTTPIYRAAYQSLNASFETLSLVRFLISALVLLVPTTLMGATLPVLSKFTTTRFADVGRSVGHLQAVNTFGAVAGSFLAGFALMPSLGIMGTIMVAAAINIVIAASVFLLARRAYAPAAEPEDSGPVRQKSAEGERRRRAERASPDSAGRGWRKSAGREEPASAPVPAEGFRDRVVQLAILAFALSGFAAMVYQVAWMRTLSLVIGSSVYAISLTLTAYILGLALGTFFASRYVDRARHLVSGLGTLQIGIGATALLVVPFLGRLPLAMVGLVSRHSGSFGALMSAEFGLILLAILVPTLLMGAVFPFVIRIATRRLEAVGRSVGNVYASNTLGAIVGSFVGGFLFIPWLGIQGSIMFAVVINLALGAALVAFGPLPRRVLKFSAIGAAAVLLIVVVPIMPKWDPVIMSSGSYLYADMYSRQASQWDTSQEEAIRTFGKVLYHKEGVATTVTVRQARSDVYLQSNGKTEASTGPDMRTQKLLAHVPMMLCDSPKSVLVIGLASGVTVGSALTYPVELLDCVEIAPAMSYVAETYFAEANGHCMDDPRLNVIIEDGRNHVAFAPRRYDVMISQPSNPWIAGISNMFTKEFFELARDRMNPGGVVGIWFQAYNMSPDEFRMIVRTFGDVFEGASVWELDPGIDYMLVGKVGGLTLDWQTLKNRLDDPSIGTDLASIGVRSPLDYTSLFLMGPSAIRSYAGTGPIHTDNGLELEFSAPRNMYRQSKIEQLAALDSYRTSPARILVDVANDAGGENEREAVVKAVEARATARRLLAEGMVAQDAGQTEKALTLYQEAERTSPGEPEVEEALSRLLFSVASQMASDGNAGQAADYYKAAIAAAPAFPQPWAALGTLYLEEGRTAEAESLFQGALRADPNFAEAHLNLAVMAGRRGDVAGEIAELERYLENAPAASNAAAVRAKIRELKGRR